MSRVPWVVVFGVVVVSCAQVGSSRRPELSSEEQAPSGWVPEAGAGEALERVWAAAPFTATPHDLALASGGTVARMFHSEILAFESRVEVDEQGRARATERSIWRVLTDSPDQTLTVRWAPWRQGRPTVRARVISATGAEKWLDASSVVEAQGTAEGVQLSDSRVLQVPLPGVKRGSVVEYETVIADTRATIEGLGVGDRWTLWTPQPVRHQRFVVEVPEGSPLTVHAVGVPVPPVKSAGGRKRVELEVGALEYKPFTLSRAEREARRPGFGWTTVASWGDVATKYAPLLSEGFADTVDLGPLEAQAKAVSTVEAKTQLALRWLSDRARYTAVHLGEGAFMPTKPSTVLARGYGDCKDLSLALVSTLRRLGVEADVALVSSGGQVPLDALPTLEAFNHAIVAVKVPGRSEVLWVDPTTPEYPVGTVAESVRDQRALLAKSGGGLVSTPRRADTVSRVVETVWYELAAFGRGSGRIRSEFFGDAEGIMRRQTKACDAAAAHELGKNSMSH